jgi:hypothetical protein
VVLKATSEAVRHMVAEVAHPLAEVAAEVVIEVEDKEVEEEIQTPPFLLGTWPIHALIGN